MRFFLLQTYTIGQRPDQMPTVLEPDLSTALRQYRAWSESTTTVVILQGRTADGQSVLGAVYGERPTMLVQMRDEAVPVWTMLDELLELRDPGRKPPFDIGPRTNSDSASGTLGDVEYEELRRPSMDGFKPDPEDPTRPRKERFVQLRFQSYAQYKAAAGLAHAVQTLPGGLLPCRARAVELQFEADYRMLERRDMRPCAWVEVAEGATIASAYDRRSHCDIEFSCTASELSHIADDSLPTPDLKLLSYDIEVWSMRGFPDAKLPQCEVRIIGAVLTHSNAMRKIKPKSVAKASVPQNESMETRCYREVAAEFEEAIKTDAYPFADPSSPRELIFDFGQLSNELH